MVEARLRDSSAGPHAAHAGAPFRSALIAADKQTQDGKEPRFQGLQGLEARPKPPLAWQGYRI